MRLKLALGILIVPLSLFGGNNLWTSNGPLGGTFPIVTFHPARSNVVFAGSFDGLYRSTDSAGTWQRLDIEEGQNLPVNIRISRQNPEDIFASSEAFLFHSTDLGDNWHVVSRLPAEFSDFEFDPSDPSILYAVTLTKGVYSSHDGGKTWIARNAGLKVAPVADCCNLPQLEVDPRNGDVLYVLLATGIAYRSSNGGGSWKALDGLKLTLDERSLVIDPQNPDTLYAGADAQGVFKTTDDGSTWSHLNCDCGVLGMALDPNKPQTIYTVGYGISKSTNGGASWTALNRTMQLSGLQVSPNSSSQIVFGGDGNGIYRSTNGGRSLQAVNNHVDAIAIRHLSSVPKRPATIFGQGDYQVYRSRNGGASWELWQFGHSYEMHDIQVSPGNPDVVAAAGFFPLEDRDACLAVSTNGGGRWDLRCPQDADGAVAVAIAPDNEKVFYIAPLSGGDNLGVARSRDQGKTWEFVNAGITDKAISEIAVDPSNGANIYAASSAGILFKSTNGGDSWKNSSTGLHGGVLHALDFDASQSNTLYAATEHGIFKSTNAGQNWTLKNHGIPAGRELWFVRTDPSNPQVVYCGFQDALFVSADGGQNWSAFDGNGLGRYEATDLLINPAEPSILHLGINRGEFSYAKSTVAGGPEILQLTPSAGKPGVTVTIQGRNFGAAQGGGKVFFGAVDAGTAVSWSDTRIEARVPSAAQTGPVTVQVGAARSNSPQFVVLASSGAIQPNAGPASGGTLVSIVSPSRGGRVSFVLFGNSLAKEARFVPPNTIVCKTPPGSGVVDVVVVSATGSARAGAFSYQ